MAECTALPFDFSSWHSMHLAESVFLSSGTGCTSARRAVPEATTSARRAVFANPFIFLFLPLHLGNRSKHLYLSASTWVPKYLSLHISRWKYCDSHHTAWP